MEFLDETSWNFAITKRLSRHLTGHNGFIAGGCFKQIFTGQKIKDIDVFFTSEEEWLEASRYFRGNDDYEMYYENKKVEAYKYKGGLAIELVRTVFGSPAEVIGSFDFTITKFAYYKNIGIDEDGDESIEYKCLYHPQYFEHLMLKRLVLDDKVPFPASTFERMVRYTKYGYFPCRDTKKAIIDALRAMPGVPDLSMSMYDGMD